LSVVQEARHDLPPFARIENRPRITALRA
jgi:hypothetical protein